jgi:hypothetical protein
VRVVHALEVLLDSVHDDSLVHCFIGLGSFKALNGVVKSCVGGLKLEWLVWHYFRSLPSAISVVIVTLKHVVCR